MCARIPVTLRQPEVDGVNDMRLLSRSNEEILGLDVPVDVVLEVDVLEVREYLVGYHEHGLEGELPLADV
jgi:hypothetical protein